MERTQVNIKLTVKKSFSIAKAQALARQAQIATENTKNVVVAAGESYSSSPSRVHLNAVSFEDDTHFGIAEAAAASQMPIAQTTQGDSYFRRISQESCTTSFKTSAQTCGDETTTQAARRTEQTGLMNRFEVEPSSAGVSGDLTVQPFDDDELEYLSSIFEQDKCVSHEEDLSSILSLDRDGTVEDFNL